MNLSELRTALKERREDYSSSDAKLDRKINQAYLDICSRRKWGWLRREYTANTYAPHTVTGYGPPVNPGDPPQTPNFAATNGSRQITFEAGPGTAGGQLPLNSMGKRILIGGSFYRVVQLNNNSANADLDRPYTGSTFPVAGPPADYGSAQLVYDEVALPLGAQAVVEATLFSGTTSYPLSLDSVRPAAMSGADKNTVAQPTRFSVIEKAPIVAPLSSVGALTASVGGGLTPGATYRYWYSHYDKITGAESALSPVASVTLTSSPVAQNRVTLPTISARNDFLVRLYRSRADGTIPYLLRDNDEASVAGFHDDTSDEYLGRRAPESASTMYLTLYPAPSSTYQIHVLYQAEANTLGGDNDRPLFDSTFSNVLLDGAEMLMLSANDEQPRSTSVQGRYESGIQRMVMQDRMDIENRVLFGRNGRRVRGARNWWYGAIPDYGSGGMGGFGAP